MDEKIKQDQMNPNGTSTNEDTRGSEIIEEKTINFVLVNQEEEEPVHHKVLSENHFKEKLHQDEYLKSKVLYHDTEPKKEKKSVFNKFIASILILAILGGFSAGAGYRILDYYLMNQPETSIQYIPELTQSQVVFNSDSTPNITSIAKKVEPSVVAITNQVVQESFFGPQTGTSAGSGVIFNISTENVYILTNHHVIDDSTDISVNFFGDIAYTANLVGSDEDTDLAVISVSIESMSQEVLNRIKPIELGDSDNIQVGEQAVAIGNPLGYNNTVTVGYISALDRNINEDLNSLSLIQTDAAINPGNSGGALVNALGQLVGINTVKISDTAVEGIGFAIPVNSALPILEEIMEKGYVSKPFIGIYGSDVTDELSEMYKVPKGVMIQDTIPNSPAQKSGLKKYDLITAINGETIETMSDLNRVIRQYGIGDTINITIQRETNKKFNPINVDLTIGDRHNY